jgi:rubrerythrin
MAIQFNAAEIYEMAEQIERNGAAFYRAAAKLNPKAGRLLLTLAEQEDKHLAIFSELHRQLDARSAEPVTYDPADEAALYLQAMADRRVFNVDQDPATLIGEKDSLDHILDIATRTEKDSIVFYTGMKPLITPALGQAKLDAIIQEEWKHIAFLSKLSANLNLGVSHQPSA